MSSLLFVASAVALPGTIRVDGEEFEGALLDRSWPGVEREDVFVVERGGRLDPRIGGEVGKQALEAVHRQAVVGGAGGLLGPGGFGARGRGWGGRWCGCRVGRAEPRALETREARRAGAAALWVWWYSMGESLWR